MSIGTPIDYNRGDSLAACQVQPAFQPGKKIPDNCSSEKTSPSAEPELVRWVKVRWYHSVTRLLPNGSRLNLKTFLNHLIEEYKTYQFIMTGPSARKLRVAA